MVMARPKKTVLITGATRGIGLKFVEHYLNLGWNVIGTARDLSKADELKSLAPYRIVQLDTGDEDSILNAAKELEGEAIDLLLNNAGVADGGNKDITTKRDLLRQFEVNAVGPFLVTRTFLPHLKAAVAKNGGAFVAQLTSYLGSITHSTEDYFIFKAGDVIGYRASKAALNMITSSLAVDLKDDQIGVFLLDPGFVATDMTVQMGIITTDASVSGLVSVIDKFTLADTGKALDYTGKIVPW
uniref:Short-chain dehydrogenase n=1 Tax=Globisporangium ultimum (strain ATCC 200006 / CBS 805.95 / DAOM BR144) TaxID=431595 RepID=K3WS08_GLOUD